MSKVMHRANIDNYSRWLKDELYERTEPVQEFVEESVDGTGRVVYRLVTTSSWMVPSEV